MDRLLKRAQVALRKLGLGVPKSLFGVDRLKAINMGLRKVGLPQLADLDSEVTVLRAVLSLEGLVGDL